MMYLTQFKECIQTLFGDLLEQFRDCGEYGFNHEHSRPVRRLGYCTNLAPEVVEQARDRQVDLIVTHHDAWDFVFGMREACVDKLQEYEIAHFYVHLPLDYAEFGTYASLLQEIGDIRLTERSEHIHGDSTIGVGELAEPMSFSELAERVSQVLAEEVKAWNFGSRTVQRIGVLTGAGDSSVHLREARQLQCDVYVTGEKSLYTVQYARFIGLNLIVGSHTFTEVFGVRSFARKVKDSFPDIEIVPLDEEHIE